ncbi:DUF2842 domain-containing protein [Puniceibacterium sp. IMCC21224]|uniref:DUF2842 domain-containing protein n=1 Tax=Puniceibacterium sp. IMCC21224 TaxID=1618204 RepID=UPI00064D9686|nr:DUF2842 domain-containing protein [Puniceibacterium sp. IMCC21224]KMK66818.1 Protein of unknown function (DUF2842) [Puniceibacterium sp. IMCC21224]
MALSYKRRRWFSVLILLVGLPLYIVLSISIMNWLGRPPLLLELGIYVALGLLWALPFKYVFRGVGQADPDEGK